MTFDAELRVVGWNAAAQALTGITAEDAIGRYCWEVLAASDARGDLVCHAGCSYARLAAEGWPVPTRRLWVKTRDGKREVAVATVAIREGDRPLYLHLLRDGEEQPDAPAADEADGTLTPRQREILGLIAEGVPAKVIAVRLGIAEVTVRNHIRGILRALGSHSQLEAVAVARRSGVLPTSP